MYANQARTHYEQDMAAKQAAAGGMISGAGEQRRPPEVQHTMQGLGKHIEVLNDTIAQLESRLSPVCRPYPPEPVPTNAVGIIGAVEGRGTYVGQQLQDLSDTVRSQTKRIGRILDLLEL